jgi:acetoin utilization protein AcuB
MLVKEIMAQNVYTVKSTDNAFHAFSEMMQHGVRHLPVMQRSKMVGIISDRDIRQSIFPWKEKVGEKAFFAKVSEFKISSVMKTEVISVLPETTIEEAAHLIQIHQIGCLPVCKKGKILGIITKSDIIDIFIAMMEHLQKSSRIDVVIDDNPESFEKVESLIKKNGGDIISVGKAPSRGKHKHINFFRIKKCETLPIAEAIKKAGFKVISVM